MEFTIRIADKVIAVSSMHEYIAGYCKDYISDDTPDFSMRQMADNDILFDVGYQQKKNNE